MAATRRLINTVAVITINHPPVNALSSSVRHALVEEFGEASKDPKVEAIVLNGSRGKFSAGADIKEFSTSAIKTVSLEDINSTIEASQKPVVAAIEGIALGGGLELALACHYRVADIQSRVGLPEVLIGILPAAGGTQRLPRLIGVPAALDMIVQGRHIPATEAQKLGIVDEVVQGNAVDAAIQLARKVIGHPLNKRRLSTLHISLNPNMEDFLNSTVEKAKKQFRGAQAPLACIEAVRASVHLPYHRGVEKERQLFLSLWATGQPQAQQYAFFSEREAGKWTHPSGARWDTEEPKSVRTAAVIGLGTMGRGIVTSLSKAKIPVIAIEQDAQQLEVGKKAVNSLLERESEKLKQQGIAPGSKLGSVHFTLDFGELQDIDLIIEAVYENMELKKEIFCKLSSVCKPDAFLCSNTSGLNIDEIASVTNRPNQVIGTHFFSPANIMRLLEVVRGQKTSLTTIATAMNLGKIVGKVAVLVGNCPLFVGNRMLGPYLEQANYLLEEGCYPEEVDRAMEEFGFAMGPFRMMDLAGLDVGWRSRTEKGLTGAKVPQGTPARQRQGNRYSPLADLLCESGRFGQKTGKGWYQYEKPGGRNARPDPWLKDFLQKYRKTHQVKKQPSNAEQIVQRCVYALANEGFRILEDGIASCPEDIDVIYNNGYGWPKYRGGPMYYASSVGLSKVFDTLEKYYKANPDVPSMKPAFLLKKLSAVGGPPIKEWRSQVGKIVHKL
ncbi:PREDICTED: peroxisomal bifunctional enzyme [Nanorana parkeri]|uniref:peroxisomal bifunctional enzyme n=1 Tax=Nanorana parkeri TaxID=125878 RepID=UPI0008541E04|nr:PREDICTED: peroxisomal bifunctional enzyme [Nanorana parkeri]